MLQVSQREKEKLQRGVKGAIEEGGDSPNKRNEDSPKNLCKGYLTAKGCAYGDNCRMYHDFASAGRQSLCYSCGSLDNRHRRQDCPTVLSPKGSPKVKGKGKGKAKAAAVATSASADAASSGGPITVEVPSSTPTGVTQGPTIAKAAVTTGVRSDPSTVSTTAQLEQEAIRILKRLSCFECQPDICSASCNQDGGSLCLFE